MSDITNITDRERILRRECDRLTEERDAEKLQVDVHRHLVMSLTAERDAAIAKLAALAAQEPVANVSIIYFRWQRSMENVEFALQAELSEGTHLLYAAAGAAPVPEWISVADHLPSSGLEVLVTQVTARKKQVSVFSAAYWHAGKDHCGSSGWARDGDEITCITHWMPMPTAPKEPS